MSLLNSYWYGAGISAPTPLLRLDFDSEVYEYLSAAISPLSSAVEIYSPTLINDGSPARGLHILESVQHYTVDLLGVGLTLLNTQSWTITFDFDLVDIGNSTTLLIANSATAYLQIMIDTGGDLFIYEQYSTSPVAYRQVTEATGLSVGRHKLALTRTPYTPSPDTGVFQVVVDGSSVYDSGSYGSDAASGNGATFDGAAFGGESSVSGDGWTYNECYIREFCIYSPLFATDLISVGT